jgi:hypothetical protein
MRQIQHPCCLWTVFDASDACPVLFLQHCLGHSGLTCAMGTCPLPESVAELLEQSKVLIPERNTHVTHVSLTNPLIQEPLLPKSYTGHDPDSVPPTSHPNTQHCEAH